MPGVIKIAILANAREAIANINKTGDAADGLGKKAKNASGGLKNLAGAAVAAGGVAVVGDALRDGVKEAGAFQDAANQTTSALKSNKSLHGLTAAQVQKSSAALESLTGAKIDENDATLAANKLIRAGVTSQADLDRALKVSSDVALGTGKDIGGVSAALSKALANPAKAAGVLGKAGVVLSKSQQDAITKLSKTGDAAGAQALIMDALEKKYKGASEAAGTGLTADLGRAQDAMADAKRDIATALMPSLSTLATAFAKNLPGAIAKIVPVFNTLVALVQNPAFLALAGAIAAVVVGMKAYTAITTVVSAATKVWAAVQAAFNFIMALNPVTLIIIGIVALIAAIVWIATKTTWFQTIWKVVWGGIKAAAVFVFNFLKTYFVAMFTFYKAVFMKGVAAFKAVWGGIKWLWDKAVAVFNSIKAAIATAVAWVATKIALFIVGVKVIWGRIIALKDRAVAVFNSIKGAIATAVDWVKTKIAAFIIGVKVIWGRIMVMVDKAIAFKNRVIGVFKGWLDWMVALPKKIIDGLLNGLKAGWTKVTDFFKGAIELIPSGIRDALGISSPSKVMRDLMQKTGDGAILGLKDSMPGLRKVVGQVSDTISGGIATDAAVKLHAEATVTRTAADANAMTARPITINVTVASGVDPVEVGRKTVAAIEAWQARTGKRRLLA